MIEEDIEAEMVRGDLLLEKLMKRQGEKFINCREHHQRTTSIMRALKESDPNQINGNGHHVKALTKEEEEKQTPHQD